MPEARQQDTTALRDALLNAYTVCIERAKVGRINAEKLSKAKAELSMVQKQLDNTIACFNHTTAIYKNIKQHDAERKEAALGVFNKAIAEVAKIVPDANMRGMHLKVTRILTSVKAVLFVLRLVCLCVTFVLMRLTTLSSLCCSMSLSLR